MPPRRRKLPVTPGHMEIPWALGRRAALGEDRAVVVVAADEGGDVFVADVDVVAAAVVVVAVGDVVLS